MVVWATLETTCPLCQNRLRVREVGSSFAAGQDSDLLIRMRGKHVIQAEIHTCLRCKFSGYTEDFTNRNVPADRVKLYFEEVVHSLPDEPGSEKKFSATPGSRASKASAKTPRRAARGKSGQAKRTIRKITRTPLPHLQYYWSALAGPTIGLTSMEIGHRLVRAYWCLRLTPTCDLARSTLRRLCKIYLREAIRHLRHGLRKEKNRVVVYLIAELCRRNGYFGLATMYFERFLHREKGQRYLKQAASRLLVAARQGDSAEKSMEELLYDEKDSGSDEDHGPQRDSHTADTTDHTDGTD